MSSNGAHAYAPLNCMCFRSLARGICFHLFACFRFYDGLPVMDNFHYETVEHFRELDEDSDGRVSDAYAKYPRRAPSPSSPRTAPSGILVEMLLIVETEKQRFN